MLQEPKIRIILSHLEAFGNNKFNNLGIIVDRGIKAGIFNKAAVARVIGCEKPHIHSSLNNMKSSDEKRVAAALIELINQQPS